MIKPAADTYAKIEEMINAYIERKYQRYQETQEITADDILEISDALEILRKIYILGGY